jgi:N-acetylglucosamine kinase-like BadF-type ATPase
MTAFVLGLDGGGTKTHVAVAAPDGELVGFSANGPSNWEMVGLVGAATAITRAVQAALNEAGVAAGDVAGTAFGLAGVDWPSDEARLAPLVARLNLGGPRVILNDSFVALRAGTSRPWGVVIISGTGAVAAGRNRDGETFRTLGLGWEFGDWGSASDIAEEALRGVANAYTGRGPETSLTEALCDFVGAASAEELLQRASRGAPGLSHEDYEDPRVAPLVIREAEGGDAVARDILDRAGASLGEAAALVARRLGMENEVFDVVLAGGLFRNESRLVDSAIEVAVRRIAHRASLVRISAAPVVGAALTALELAGEQADSEARARLTREVRDRLARLSNESEPQDQGQASVSPIRKGRA